MSNVIVLPVVQPPPKSCFDCEHAAVGPVTYCSLFREEIMFESEAEDCDEFDPIPGTEAADG